MLGKQTTIHTLQGIQLVQFAKCFYNTLQNDLSANRKVQTVRKALNKDRLLLDSGGNKKSIYKEHNLKAEF